MQKIKESLPSANNQQVQQVVDAYVRFMNHMKKLNEEEWQMVHDAFRSVDDEKMREIRKRISEI